MTGSALSPFHPIDDAQALIEQGEKIGFPANSAIGTLIIFSKIAKAIFAPFGAFIMENGQGGMIHIVKQKDTSFRRNAGGGGGSPHPKGGKGARHHQTGGAKRPRQSAGVEGAAAPLWSEANKGWESQERRLGLWG